VKRAGAQRPHAGARKPASRSRLNIRVGRPVVQRRLLGKASGALRCRGFVHGERFNYLGLATGGSPSEARAEDWTAVPGEAPYGSGLISSSAFGGSLPPSSAGRGTADGQHHGYHGHGGQT